MADEDGDVGSRGSAHAETYEWSTPAVALMQAPRPRSIDGTPPGRISSVWNVETPMESGGGRPPVSRPVRKVDPPVGIGTSKKRMPAAERQREYITGWIGQYPVRKDADVDVVSHPKNDGTIVNRRES
jgi:hypothetical protein